MAEEEVSAGDSVVGSSGRMVTGSLNLPGHLFMPGGSLLMPEARLRQEGSMDSRVPDGLAGQAAGVATPLPLSFCLGLSRGSLLFLPHSCFSMRKLGCLVVHLWGPWPGIFFIWRSSCISSCRYTRQKVNQTSQQNSLRGKPWDLDFPLALAARIWLRRHKRCGRSLAMYGATTALSAELRLLPSAGSGMGLVSKRHECGERLRTWRSREAGA